MAVTTERSPLSRTPRAPFWSWVHHRSTRADAGLMFLAALASLAIQWPHRPHFLFIWDSFLFANAAIEYDLLGGYPHPPGYPVFVFLVRLLSSVTDSENALELVSMAFAAVSAALLFGFLREQVSRPGAAIATTLFLFSPTLIYNGLMAVSYTAECAASIGVAWLAWRQRKAPTIRGAIALAVLLGIGAGLRTTVLLFLFPVAAWAIWGERDAVAGRLARFFAAAAAGLVAILAWMVPMFVFGGSPRVWIRTTRIQGDVVIFENTVFNNGFAAVQDQSGRLVHYLQPELAVVALAVVAALAAATTMRRVGSLTLGELRFIAFWIVPSLLFFAFVFSGWNNGPRGYALILLPSLFFLLGGATHEFVNANLTRAGNQKRRGLVIAVTMLLALAPIPLLVDERDELLASDVYERNSWGTSWMGLRDTLSPNETAILTSHEWEFARWYFPEYTVWGYLPGTTHPDWTAAEWHFVLEAKNRIDDRPLYGVYMDGTPPEEHPIPESVRRVVLTDFGMAGEGGRQRALLPDVQVKELILDNGWRVLYFDVDARRPTIEAYLRPLGTADR